ncbi:MAG: crotonobetaine/carnitine-CoA ligase [Rhodobacteraceae bacterium HLUCCA12]|nr:MAG: crotonobetaine/carnitine-CoA ligase [Rhodobacteraceae bacterium HLUCCA12]
MPQVTSPYEAFARSAARLPAQDFVRAPASAALPWAPSGYALTYDAAARQIAALRDAYVAAGYGAGSRLALLLLNRPEFLLHWLALNAIGASVVPLNGDMRPDELRHQMEVSQAEAVIAVPGFEALLATGLPPGVPVASFDAPPPPAATPRPPRAGLPDDEAALLFTSGSTGKPKACILSNHYLINVAQWYVSMPGIAAMRPDCEVSLTPLPFFHMNALGCTALGMMLIGGTIVPLDRFSASRWWATVADSGATIVHGLGVIPAILLQLPESPDERRHRARFIFSPGVEDHHKAAFEARFGLPVVEGWAMTETGGAAITDTAGLTGPLGPRCIGRPRAGMEWRIVDEAGRDVEPGAPGELLVRSQGDDPRRGFFSGYLGDPAATEAAWEGGWFHTGDVVRVDAQGLFYFIDRRKSIIRRAGENISALEVETALQADPALRAAAVTPVSDPIRGEEVFAFVVPGDPVETANPQFSQTLMARLAERLSYHKLPGWLLVVDELPLGATQKLQRGQIRRNAEAALADGHALDVRQIKGAARAATS